MTYRFLTILLAASVLAVTPWAYAEKADRDKPMNVEADDLRHDDLKQTSVFTGKVVATKGSIVIRGARLEVRQDPEGFQHGLITAEPGKRAFWRQKREGADDYLEGEAETIDYDGKGDRVKFIGRAEMRRYRGTTLADETQGSLITYENTTDVFTVNGAPLGQRAPGAVPGAGGRVRAVLAPRVSSPGSTSAPAGAASAPAPLRASPGLAGERK